MAIDPADVEAIWKKAEKEAAEKPAPQYQILQVSQAWTHMLGWLKELREKHEKDLLIRTELLQQSQDYSHDGLVCLKASMDIAQAELYTIRALEAKITAYHQEED